MELKQYTIEKLSELTASNSAAPGGGSVSALAGAFAASLACMVAKLTLGKKGYEEVSEQMTGLDERAESLRLLLLDQITRDASSFDAFMAALKLPKDSEEEKAARTQAMQDALKKACEIPLETAKWGLEVMRMALECIRLGNANAASDGFVGALMARTAVLGALSNVRINLAGIKDEEFTGRMKAACIAIEEEARSLEREADAALNKRI